MMYADNSQHNKPHFHVYFIVYKISICRINENLAGNLAVIEVEIIQDKEALK